MKSLIRKFLPWITSIVSLIVLFLLNAYLMEEKYLFYATGSGDKAILNVTWLMSEKEVGRAIGCPLFHSWEQVRFEELPPLPPWVGFPKVLKPQRYKDAYSNCISITRSLTSDDTKARYIFFDDELIALELRIEDFSKPKLDSLVTKLISANHGKPTISADSTKQWKTNKVSVRNWFFSTTRENPPRWKAVINIQYLPKLDLLRILEEQEKKDLF